MGNFKPRRVDTGVNPAAAQDGVEQYFAHEKNRYGLLIWTVGIARARAKLMLTNLAYNLDHLIFQERCKTMGEVRLQTA